MIFVTTGTQEPFDRLIRSVDQFAPNWNGEKVIAQAGAGEYKPENIEFRSYLSPVEYAEIFDKSRLIIAHAGTGTILSALINRKPILVLPRQASLGEHRNDHQIGTAKKFSDLGYVTVADDAEDLHRILARTNDYDFLLPSKLIGPFASLELLSDLEGFIRESN